MYSARSPTAGAGLLRLPANCDDLRHLHTIKIKINRSDSTPDPGGYRPQHPCAQGRTLCVCGHCSTVTPDM